MLPPELKGLVGALPPNLKAGWGGAKFTNFPLAGAKNSNFQHIWLPLIMLKVSARVLRAPAIRHYQHDIVFTSASVPTKTRFSVFV